MGKNVDDPYSGTKSMLIFSNIAIILSLFLPVLTMPFGIQKWSILDLYDLGLFSPLLLLIMGVNVLVFAYAYVEIEENNAKAIIVVGSLLPILPLLGIQAASDELNRATETFIDITLVSISLGFMILAMAIILGFIGVLSFPSEEDLAKDGRDMSQPRYDAAPAKPEMYDAAPAKSEMYDTAPAKPSYTQSYTDGDKFPAKNLDDESQDRVYCKTCGVKQEKSNFCINCGNKLV